MNYEPTLWLIPYKYGLRIKDGKWIDKRTEEYIDTTNKSKVTSFCRSNIEIIETVTDLKEGQIIFDVIEQAYYVVIGGRANQFIKIM